MNKFVTVCWVFLIIGIKLGQLGHVTTVSYDWTSVLSTFVIMIIPSVFAYLAGREDGIEHIVNSQSRE